MPHDLNNPKDFLVKLFRHFIEAADPAHCLAPFLPAPPKGRTIVIGAGKAAASMARAVEDNWTGPLQGLVVTRYDHGVDCDQIEVVEAAHPVPDAAGIAAARRILQQLKGLDEDDLVLCLISGGGSALLVEPADGISLEEKQAINRQLLKCGVAIDKMNVVRKHLSAIKGGRLALAARPAQVVSLAISDVPGDDPAIIASGPTVFDASTSRHALEILDQQGIEISSAVKHYLENQDHQLAPFESDFRMIATPQTALNAAAHYCFDHGIRPVILSDAVEGEARHVAGQMADFVRQFSANPLCGDRPIAFLSGGETTVTVKGNGRGGRNAEYLLALGLALDHHPGIFSLAGDSDGIDGSEDNAGCVWEPDTLQRATVAGLDPEAMLTDNDGYGFFSALDDLIITGPTRTNVNDFRATLVMTDQRVGTGSSPL